MSRYFKYIFSILIIAIFASCSTKKNTGTRRFYHNLTSRYNILFNGVESYKAGMQKLKANYTDNYNEILPVFLYDNPDKLSGISGNMTRTIEKSTKLITEHSITVKPEIDPDKPMTEKDREFYNRHNFNKWIDEAYYYMGMAQFYLHDFDNTSQTFTYLVTNFGYTIASKKARIWQARLAMAFGRFKEAEEILMEFSEIPEKVIKELEGLIYPTWADFYLKKQDYTNALEYLEKSYNATSDKYYKTRYAYIIAQVYQKTGQYERAIEYFDYVVRLNPPYEMTFNAKIEMALSYRPGKTSRKDIEARLRKMLKDDKNIEYQDQVYYALGNIAYKENEEQNAINLYKKSLNVSTGNNNQLAASYLVLADIYYQRPDYFLSQAYYDSVISVIGPDYPNYKIIYNKSVSLTDLVTNLATVQLQDSVQQLATMPKPGLNALIDKLIVEHIEREKAEKERELMVEDDFFAQATFETAGANTSWYFYNPTTVSKGKQEFMRIWGNRRLEDNWRRKNKATVEFTPQETIAENGTKNGSDTSSIADINNPKARDFYLKNIPFKDDELAQSHETIKKALVSAGNTYFSELKDYDNALKTYEDLIQRYPSFNRKLEVYYNCYNIGTETNNEVIKAKYKQRIISEFPNSTYAKALINPKYFKEIEAMEKEITDYYTNTYKIFLQGNNTAAFQKSKLALEKYPDHELYPKFDYINTISGANKGDTVAFIQSLEGYKEKYPGNELNKNIDMLISFLKESKPSVAKQVETKEAKAIYSVQNNAEHYVMISLPSSANTNQLTFNILTFNVDYFSELSLNTKTDKLNNGYTLCRILKFKNGAEAMKYRDRLQGYPDLWKDVSNKNAHVTVITNSNLSTLTSTGELNKYILFYNETYK